MIKWCCRNPSDKDTENHTNPSSPGFPHYSLYSASLCTYVHTYTHPPVANILKPCKADKDTAAHTHTHNGFMSFISTRTQIARTLSSEQRGEWGSFNESATQWVHRALCSCNTVVSLVLFGRKYSLRMKRVSFAPAPAKNRGSETNSRQNRSFKLVSVDAEDSSFLRCTTTWCARHLLHYA